MARREMRWFRYLCEGQKRGGSNCDGLIMVCAVDEGLADIKAMDEYDWHHTKEGAWLCDLPHRDG